VDGFRVQSVYMVRSYVAQVDNFELGLVGAVNDLLLWGWISHANDK
jgi:hypothetical protein